ncbi:hypothetical protein [Microbispora sp. NPDC049633]|uniref:hypothetical protein n=1 Tax=Microbispora sp. NPDC049633 TaxID=3154355 RepID=UPI00344800FC
MKQQPKVKIAQMAGALTAGVARLLWKKIASRRSGPEMEPDSTDSRIVYFTYSPTVNSPTGEELIARSSIKLVPAGVLATWSRIKRYQDLTAADYVLAGDEGGRPVVCVSHRWIETGHPDPQGQQLREIQGRLRELAALDARYADCLVFYDYSAVPQEPRTPDEDLVQQREINALGTLFGTCDKVIILSEGYRDYIERAWCFFEAFAATRDSSWDGETATANVHFFADQQDIRTDLEFLLSSIYRRMFGTVVSIRTSFGHTYKPELREVQNIAAVFQHFGSCGTTRPDDKPMLKQMLVTEFLTRKNMTPYARLLIAINKFFDVTLCIMTSKMTICPTVSRIGRTDMLVLQSLAVDGQGAGEMEVSPLAISREDAEIYKRELIQEFVLRLTCPDGSSPEDLIQTAREARDWKEYFVPAYSPAADEYADRALDLFPTRDHVLHTMLALNLPFISHPDGHVYFPIMQPENPEFRTAFTSVSYDNDGKSTQLVTLYQVDGA